MEEVEKRKEELKKIEADQVPQQLKIDREREKELELLITKHESEHGKKIQRNQELPFKALMQMRS